QEVGLVAHSNPITYVFTRETITSFNNEWDIPVFIGQFGLPNTIARFSVESHEDLLSCFIERCDREIIYDGHCRHSNTAWNTPNDFWTVIRE
ncbi:hypothetical protein, partial [Aporhodopirellula rubra]